MNNYFKFEKEIVCKDTGEVCKGYEEYLNSSHWKQFRHLMLENIKCCCICEEKSVNYNLHHVNYNNLGNETEKDIRIICSKCHKLAHKLELKIDCLKNEYKNTNNLYCKKCGGKDIYYKKHVHNMGVFCKGCGKWIKWLNKKEKSLLTKNYIH